MWRYSIFAITLCVLTACGNPFATVPELRKAAEQGDADAQLRLAERYFVGDGIGQDQEKSVFWFRKAAALGHHYGYYRLGESYEFGRGVLPDIKLAAASYEKAARLNSANGQDALARLHMSGALGARDYQASYKWQILAARHNGLMWEAGDYGAARFLSPAQKSEAERAATKLVDGFK